MENRFPAMPVRKEVRELMMSMMDEAEKQISYEENFEVVVQVKQLCLTDFP